MSVDEQLQRNIARRRKSQDWPYGHSLSPEKVAQLQALGRDSSVKAREILERIFHQSSRKLKELSRDVRECKNVDTASDFSSWLMFSGVCDLLEMFPDLSKDFLQLRKAAKDLHCDCGEIYKCGKGKVQPKYAQSDISEINRKLDILMSERAKPAVDVRPHSDEVQFIAGATSAQKGCQP
jgi:hypothetical protein